MTPLFPRTHRTIRALDREIRLAESRHRRAVARGIVADFIRAAVAVQVLQCARRALCGASLRPYFVNGIIPGSGIRPPGRPRTRPRRSPGRSRG